MPVAAADAVETAENKTAETKIANIAAKDTSIAPPTTNTPSESTLAPAESAQQERELIDGTFALAGQTSNEIIFIDSAVEGLENFLLNHSQSDVVLLDPDRDGMEQIAATLEGSTGIEAIHILSHGSSGQLNLGNDTFNLESMNGEHTDEIATIKSALSEEADILIYGCDVGADEDGKTFIAALSAATGADIAASTDLTGSAALGGDWELESRTGLLETESFALDAYDGILLDPIVDLNSGPTVTVTGPVVTVSSATNDLITSGDFGTVNGPVPPAPWVEAGAGAGTAAVVNADNRYRLRDDAVTFSQALTVPTDTSSTTVTSSSTATTTTDVSTTVATTNEITSISFDFAWQNIDITGADDNQLRISYNGTLYATFDTIRGVAGEQNVAGLVGNWNYFNGASEPPTTLSVVNEITDPMTSITINLPTGVTASASLDFFYTAGSSGSGTDDVAFDNVVVNNTATTTTSVTTTTTTSDTTDNDWTSTFTENGAAVSIADIDSSIFDGDSANMASAAISLTNQTTGDRLLVNGSSAASGTLASGIAWTRTDTSVTLSGVFTKAQYVDAIELVQFENTTENPSTTPRIINVTVNDGTVDSNVAVATINVTAVDDAPVKTVPGAQSVNEDTSLLIPGISVNDVDGNLATTQLTVGSGTITVNLAGGAISAGANGSANLTISGTQTQINAALATATYQGNLNFSGTDTLTVLSTDSSGTPLTDSDTVTINVIEVYDPIVDLNSDPTVTVTGPVVTMTSATTGLITSGDFGTTAGQVPPAPWVESGQVNRGRVVNDGTGDMRYRFTRSTLTLSQPITVPTDTTNTTVTSSSTETTTTDVSTTVTTANEIASITFDMAWQNADVTGADDNQLRISYNGVLYATFDTVRGNAASLNQPGLVGNWNYFNGASGPATTLSVTNETTGVLTPITISLPTGVTTSAQLDFLYANGSSGNGRDDVAIDNVEVNNTTTTTTSVTTTVTTADTTDNDWTSTFTENGPAVSIADIDSSIFDGDSANMASAAITLTNQTTGDRLLVNGSSAASGTIASGIAWTRTDTSVSFSGSFTKAEYADAIELVQFENTTDNPSTTARIINVTVNDGSQDSNVAVATINVTPVDDAPVNNFIAGPLAATEDTSLLMTGFSVTDFDVGDPTAVASTVLSVDMGGSLTVVPAGTATIAGNGTNSVTITGTAAEINLVLAGNVTYQGALNFNGAETVNMLTTDTGGVNSDSDYIVINVAPADDAPVNTVPGPQMVAEDTSLLISGISVNDVDNNLATT